eukprot:m51a1_g2399 hypothetical protein (288) ;mRNA; r:760090-761111
MDQVTAILHQAQAADWPALAQQAAGVVATLHERPLHPVFHASWALLAMALMRHSFRGWHWLADLCLSVLACTGGGLLAAVWCGLVATSSPISHPFIVPLLMAAWLVVRVKPLYWATLLLFPVLMPLVAVFNASCMASWLYIGATHFPHSVFGTIFVSVSLMRAGGWAVWLVRSACGDLPPKSGLAPEAGFRTVLWSVVAYYVVMDPAGVIYAQGAAHPVTPLAANAALVALYFVDILFGDLKLINNFCLFYPLEALVGAVLGALGLHPAARPARPAASPKAAKPRSK